MSKFNFLLLFLVASFALCASTSKKFNNPESLLSTSFTITWPKNWDGNSGNNPIIECSFDYKKDLSGKPDTSFTGRPSGWTGFCDNVTVSYYDLINYVSIPEPLIKISRKWSVFVSCSGQIFNHDQIIMLTTPVLICNPVIVNSEESLNPNQNKQLMLSVPNECNANLSYSDGTKVSLCNGTGIFNRIWSMEFYGRITKCHQTIKVICKKPLDHCSIQFPPDLKVNGFDDPSLKLKPVWNESACDVAEASIIKADTVKLPDHEGFKVTRVWLVLDYCIYRNNTGEWDFVPVTAERKIDCENPEFVYYGFYAYEQKIIINDTIGPEIIVQDKTVRTKDCYAYETELTASGFNIGHEEKLQWSYCVTDIATNDTIQVSYNFLPKPSGIAVGKRSKDRLDNLQSSKLVLINPIAFGNYKVKWIAKDIFGNITTKDQFFTVRDETPPTPLIVDIALIKPENGVYESKAIDFDKGGCGGGCISSFDNCSPQADLYFTFSPLLPKLYENPEMWVSYFVKHGFYSFDPQTGEFVNDTLEYSLYRTGKAHRWYSDKNSAGKTWNIDADNNKKSFIYVWDKFALNEDQNDNNYYFAPVIIKLEFAPQGPTINGIVPDLKMIMNAESEEGTFSGVSDIGTYSIEVLPDKTYTVSGYSDDYMLDGVTTLDLVIIEQYTLGLREFNNKQFIAGDLDGDCEVHVNDILLWRDLILGIGVNLYHSYVTFNHDYIFKDSLANFEDCKAAKVRIVEPGTQDIFGIDFSVIKIGDLNLSHNFLEDRSADTHIFSMNNSHFSPGDRVVVPVYSMGSEDISGFQFSLSFNGLQYRDLISGALEIEDSEYRITDGHLLMSVARGVKFQADESEPLFYLVFEAVSEGTLSGSLQFNNEKLRSEIYHGKDLLISDLELSFNTNTFRLFQNTPNPFTDETNIGFELPESSGYDFQITDITGKVIYKIKGRGEKGYNLIRINNIILPSSLTLGIYSLKTDLYSDSKKLIRMRGK